MAEDNEKEDPNFNPMDISKYKDRKYCEENNILPLHALAMSNFKQQNMPAWRPIPSLLYSVSIFLVVAAIGIAFGVPLLSNISCLLLLVLSSQIVEVKKRYDDLCPDIGKICTIEIEVTSKMTKNVQLYYELENFYQNHRIYLKSVVLNQLMGSDLSSGSLDDCSPAKWITDIGIYSNLKKL